MGEQRRPLISANWKMNLNHFEAIKLVQELSYAISRDDVDAVDISIHPPFTDLRTVQTTLESDKIPFFLGAQNCHPEKSGAYTGEISNEFLKKLNVKYVIVGHSERRQLFHEDNAFINQKVKSVLTNEMSPILCVGETLDEREQGLENQVVQDQLKNCLKNVKSEDMESVVVAYEPIWAIGTGQTASSQDAQDMSNMIRNYLGDLYDTEISQKIRIQYGGSVKPNNVFEIISQEDIDGALVGGASLESGSFSEIVKYRFLAN